jgi:flagellar basal-body rod modification protein FlgD
MSAINNITGAGATSASNTTNTNAALTAQGTDALANSQTFLTLLVAQLKNQDPTQPADGMQFVTQLAQFSNLEQSVAMRTDIDAIKTKYVASTAVAPAASSTNG